ncbi:MAG: crossover junction endodeoxyribonuclease RuvC, partial [Lentisphaerae bacterium]|nr:crossover junction endodeoxyribonuclease RuvC [Lentisphaerota bacterium]
MVPCKILGVDTSLRSTGVAIVEAQGSRFSVVDYGLVRNAPRLPLSHCLCRLDRALRELIARHEPRAAAIEGIFFCKNVKTAVILGEARGVVIAACAASGLPVFEYSPRKVKESVVGNGAAGKEQVNKMIMTLLGLRQPP